MGFPFNPQVFSVQASLLQGGARIGAESLRSDARGRGTADIGSPRASNVARDTKARSNALHGIPKFYGKCVVNVEVGFWKKSLKHVKTIYIWDQWCC